ncbi:jg16316 [Pararge aegeria aegeria]|uniref:Jg16316 protein n=1 Tax=Pararge aegeria aegeria TaxID=348720 RepID=A0A8S4S1L7_9NEOP|nr:jg16316 [Pararge aegeria aegeria]
MFKNTCVHSAVLDSYDVRGEAFYKNSVILAEVMDGCILVLGFMNNHNCTLDDADGVFKCGEENIFMVAASGKVKSLMNLSIPLWPIGGPVTELLNDCRSNLTYSQGIKAKQFLLRFADIFSSRDPGNLGRTSFIQKTKRRHPFRWVWPWGVLWGCEGRDRRGARAARVAHSPESRALRNACIIIMTDADRAAAPLICAAFDLAAGAGPAAPASQTSRPPLTFIRSDAARRGGPSPSL